MSADSCSPTFEFEMTEDFFIELLRRYRRCSVLAKILMVFSVVLALILAGVVVTLISHKMYAEAVFFSAFILFLLFRVQISDWQSRRNFRKSPYSNDFIQMQLSESGVETKGTKSSTKLDWSIFTRARRFSDGYLLYQGPHLVNWLPFSCLVTGSVEDADAMVTAHIADHKPAK